LGKKRYSLLPAPVCSYSLPAALKKLSPLFGGAGSGDFIAPQKA